jgi:Glycosyltransferase
MKVLFLLTRGDEIGGAQTHVRDVILGLRDSYNIDCILATGALGNFTDEMQRKGVEVYHVKSMRREICLNDFKALLELRNLVKNIKPDIISCHSSKAGVLGRLATIGLNVKKVFTAHGWAFTEGIPERKAKFYKNIELALSYITDAIINVSKYDRDLAIKNNIKSTHYVIHNCISDNNDTRSKTSPTIIDSPLRFVMVARFCDQKDHETLIRALSAIMPNQWKLSLLGGGDNEKIKKMVANLNIDSNVDFIGEVSNVNDYLRNADVFVLISNYEGFPISIIEAMKFGLPVIASNVGGVCEAVFDNKNGYLIPRKDMVTLQNRLQRIIDNPYLISEFSKESRAIYEQQFTINKMVNSYHSVFSEVIK